MAKIVKVNEKNYICKINDDLNIKEGDKIILSDENILYLGTFIKDTKCNKIDNLKFVRFCTKQDIKENEKNIKDAAFAIIKCKQLIKKYQLDMNIVNAYYTFDRKQLLFFFTSDNRVDFRNLAKDLATNFKARIELRQIGVRDKAKCVGGIGSCGKQLCCHKFLNNLDSVSINMAKNQNLALNPNKINGACGRLLCCLKYEDEQYSEARKKLPKIGQVVDTSNGKGKVISTQPIDLSYKVEIDDNIIDIKVEY